MIRSYQAVTMARYLKQLHHEFFYTLEMSERHKQSCLKTNKNQFKQTIIKTITTKENSLGHLERFLRASLIRASIY